MARAPHQRAQDELWTLNVEHLMNAEISCTERCRGGLGRRASRLLHYAHSCHRDPGDLDNGSGRHSESWRRAN